MLQQDQPEDYVIATGNQLSAREFTRLAAGKLGITLNFEGCGESERAVVSATNRHTAPELKEGGTIVKVGPRYYRPAEVDTPLGDAAKARTKLGWTPKTSIDEMGAEMIASGLEQAKQASLLKLHGHTISVPNER